MVKCKLRVRHLTLVPGALQRQSGAVDEGAIDDEANHILAREHLHWAVEVSVESSLVKKSGPHIHGVDVRFLGQFWAMGCDSESDLGSEEEDQFEYGAKVRPIVSSAVVGFCEIQRVLQRELEVRNKAMNAQAPRLQPWEGPLPAPRISPKLSIGNTIGKAHVRIEMDRPCVRAAKEVSVFQWCNIHRSPECAAVAPVRCEVLGAAQEFQISNTKFSMGWASAASQESFRNRASGLMGFNPNSPYQPVPRLVALFGRAASLPYNPRAPCINAKSIAGFSYAAIAMFPSDNGRGSRGFGLQQ
jgi:hypothetical protein